MSVFGDYATEIVTWASANKAAALSVAVGFVAAGALTVSYIKNNFMRSTASGFDDPNVQAARQRNKTRFQRLSIRRPNEP